MLNLILQNKNRNDNKDVQGHVFATTVYENHVYERDFSFNISLTESSQLHPTYSYYRHNVCRKSDRTETEYSSFDFRRCIVHWEDVQD